MTPPIQLLVGSRDLTDAYSDLNFSNVDPGGYESLSVTLSDPAGVREGDTVHVCCGLDTAWHGRVNEIGARDGDGRTITQIAALGHGAKLTDKRLRMIYADRDLSHWKGASSGRRTNLLSTGGFSIVTEPSVVTDQALPALRTLFPGAWDSGVPTCEAWYDAGDGCVIGYIQAQFQPGPWVGTGDANWLWAITASTDDLASVFDGTGDLTAPGPATALLPTTGGNKRFGLLQFYYDAFPGGFPGIEYNVDWSNLVVGGDHGLTGRGSTPQGFYPADIAGHALADSGAGFVFVADDSSGLIVHHAVYRDPVPHERVIADMATLMGWHYGVWEPQTIFDDVPRLFLTAPPAAPTCVIGRRDIADLDSPRVRVDRLYDTAQVKWVDPAGTAGVQAVTLTNPLTGSAGVAGRVLDLDMGQGDSTSAAAYGTFALQLALAGARGGGSGTIADSVTLPGGGRKAACLLKSGRDRLRILDLPGSGSITETDANRQDSFLVRRVETNVKNGQPTTRVEFDGGADLLEVLTARLAMSAFG